MAARARGRGRGGRTPAERDVGAAPAAARAAAQPQPPRPDSDDDAEEDGAHAPARWHVGTCTRCHAGALVPCTASNASTHVSDLCAVLVDKHPIGIILKSNPIKGKSAPRAKGAAAKREYAIAMTTGPYAPDAPDDEELVECVQARLAWLG